jgi:hypothetical protein
MARLVRNPKKLALMTRFRNSPDSLSKRTISDFWQWGFSDLIQNTTRGILGEYLVAVLLGVDDEPRNPWIAYDLKLSNGMTVEVKTTSVLQAWAQNKLYEPRFVLAPTRRWDPETGNMNTTPSLNADLYIFCYFTARDHSAANPLDLDQWEFFVFERKQIEKIFEGKKSISLKDLRKVGAKPLSSYEVAKEVARLADADT